MDLGSGEGGSGLPTTDDLESLISTTDAELLKPARRNEKGAPQILQFEDALIHRSREQIQLMEETVEEYTKSGVDPLTLSRSLPDGPRQNYVSIKIISKNSSPKGFKSHLKQSSVRHG
nr:DNA replication complex GINS protein SLD5-like [Ipomoea batatas]